VTHSSIYLKAPAVVTVALAGSPERGGPKMA